MIHAQNLCKTFKGQTEVAALRGINLQVDKGDIFGIIGMSGAGKSTLLRCIALLEEPTDGNIAIDGTDLSTVKGKDLIALRRSIGVIFQGYHLLMQRTVAQNVAFPLELQRMPRAQIQQRVDELLQLVGLSDKSNAYPTQLSGGQKQRVAIARALASNPKILLCDEPTSALDSLTTQAILDLLRSINRELGVTIIIITHEIGVVRHICNRVAVINEGTFVEQGDTCQVLEQPQTDITKLLLGIRRDA